MYIYFLSPFYSLNNVVVSAKVQLKPLEDPYLYHDSEPVPAEHFAVLKKVYFSCMFFSSLV